MSTNGQLFKFEQKQQSTFKDKCLDFIANDNYDSFYLSYKKDKIRAVREKGDSIEIFTAEKTKYGEFIEATTINQPKSKEERKNIIIDLRNREMTQIEIATATGLSQSRVSQILNAQ